jgi:3-oxoacyl-[acyl-carrier protein] reductase
MSVTSLIVGDLADDSTVTGDDPLGWWKFSHRALTSSFQLTQHVVPAMRTAGAGAIVFVTPPCLASGDYASTAAAALGHGAIALTKALARELAPDGIRVNAVSPVAACAPDGGLRRLEHELSNEVADLAAFLSGDRSSSFVGQVLRPTGRFGAMVP